VLRELQTNAPQSERVELVSTGFTGVDSKTFLINGTRLPAGKTNHANHAVTTKSEGASAEDSGNSNFHRNRLPGSPVPVCDPVTPERGLPLPWTDRGPRVNRHHRHASNSYYSSVGLSLVSYLSS
jgi:hypothetical protein